MNIVREPAKDVPVVCETDVVVVGGSCTGVFAAVRAARLGMRVAVIEKQNCFGGMATAGTVNVWHSLHDMAGDAQIIAGLTGEIIDRLRKRDAVHGGNKPRDAFRLNTEELKIELDELVAEHDIQPFLNTVYVAPVCAHDRIDAVLIENKNGRQAIRAKAFVDATGDADMARHLGIALHGEGSFQPPTTCAKIYGMKSLGQFDWVAAVREHGSEFGLEPDWGWGGEIPGMPDIQFRADTHVFNVDVTDAGQLIRAEIEGRRKVRAVMDVIRAYGPPEARIALVDLAAALGARESRRITARYRLTGEDVLNGRRFEDAVANGTYPVDTHHSDGPGITFRYLDGTQRVVMERGLPSQTGRWRDPLPEETMFYQIPMRCLVQEKIANLVFAGRMIDADKTAFSAIRVMVNLNQTGEAAGVACALAVAGGKTIAGLDAREVRKTLANGGSAIL